MTGPSWCANCEDNEDTGDMGGCPRHRAYDPQPIEFESHEELHWAAATTAE